MSSAISPLAFIGEGVTVGNDVSIGPGAVILGPCVIEDGVWIGGGDIWKFTPMEIFVVDKETRKTIAKVKTYEEAEEAAEEYEGDAGADIAFCE